MTADNRGLGSAILFHETSGIGPEPMVFGDGIAVTHPGATSAKVSLPYCSYIADHTLFQSLQIPKAYHASCCLGRVLVHTCTYQPAFVLCVASASEPTCIPAHSYNSYSLCLCLPKLYLIFLHSPCESMLGSIGGIQGTIAPCALTLGTFCLRVTCLAAQLTSLCSNVVQMLASLKYV